MIASCRLVGLVVVDWYCVDDGESCSRCLGCCARGMIRVDSFFLGGGGRWGGAWRVYNEMEGRKESTPFVTNEMDGVRVSYVF